MIKNEKNINNLNIITFIITDSQFDLGFPRLSVTHLAIKIISTTKHPPPKTKNAIPKKLSLLPT
jgi:hypothetical protein